MLILLQSFSYQHLFKRYHDRVKSVSFIWNMNPLDAEVESRNQQPQRSLLNRDFLFLQLHKLSVWIQHLQISQPMQNNDWSDSIPFLSCHERNSHRFCPHEPPRELETCFVELYWARWCWLLNLFIIGQLKICNLDSLLIPNWRKCPFDFCSSWQIKQAMICFCL